MRTLKWIPLTIVALAAIGGAGLLILDRTVFAPVAVSTGAPLVPTLPLPGLTQSPATQEASPIPSAEIEQASSATPTKPQDPTGASPSPGGGGESAAAPILYQIDAQQSEVRYEVGETFFENNRFAVAIGRTRGIAGEVLVDFSRPANSQIGEIVVDISQLTSDESRRDNFIRRSALESASYPHATFRTLALEGLPESVTLGDTLTFTVRGELTVKETTLPVAWKVTLTVGEGRLSGTAEGQVLMSDFGVGPIRISSLATEDLVKLFFDFVLVPKIG